MTPIQTEYGGCRFRSRIEARWAVFFDALNIKWEYEPEGFELGGGARYLPDFHLPDTNTWVEIKGKSPSDKEIQTCQRFSQHVHCGEDDSLQLMLVAPELAQGVLKTFIDFAVSHGHTADDAVTQAREHLEKRPKVLLLEGLGDKSFVFINGKAVGSRGGARDALWCLWLLLFNVGNKTSLEDAITAARGARFEHGENGHPRVRNARLN
jgi:hypothetical protein